MGHPMTPREQIMQKLEELINADMERLLFQKPPGTIWLDASGRIRFDGPSKRR